jgi:hypothetical protein
MSPSDQAQPDNSESKDDDKPVDLDVLQELLSTV